MKKFFFAVVSLFLLFQLTAKDKNLKETDSSFDRQGRFYSKDKVHYGYKNKSGKVVIPAIYKNISYCNENIFFVTDDELKSYFINSKNKKISDRTFTSCGFFHDGITYVRNYRNDPPRQFRLYNIRKDELSDLLPEDYWFAGGFWDGVAPLFKNNADGESRCYLVNTKLEPIVSEEFGGFSEYNLEEECFYMLTAKNETVVINVKQLMER